MTIFRCLQMIKEVVPLRKLSMFQNCSNECLAMLVQDMRQHVFMQNEFICRVEHTIHMH